MRQGTVLFCRILLLFEHNNIKDQVIKIPRVARKYSASGVYHIILRGNGRRKRFIMMKVKHGF